MAEREKDEEILLTEKERTESSEQKEQTTATSQRRRLWSSLFTEGESEGGEGKGLKEVVQAVQIDGKWFFKQIPLFLLILGGILLLVTNRYQAQQEIIEREQLIKDVEDWKFQSLTRSSELTTQTRQSKIEERLRSLGDSTLSPAKEPPFTINPND